MPVFPRGAVRLILIAAGMALPLAGQVRAKQKHSSPAGSGSAQKPSPLRQQVTVRARLRQRKIEPVPVAVTHLGRRRLGAAAPVNLDGVLHQVASLNNFRDLSSLAAHPTTQGISLLGIGSSGASRTLVLLDGLPLNDPFGGWVDWLRVPVVALASVTVVSAGASALYGNNALTGVVSLRTWPATSRELRLRAGGGAEGMGFSQGLAAWSWRHWSAKLSLNQIHFDGYIPAARPGSVDTRAGVRALDAAPELLWTPDSRLVLRLGAESFGEHRTNGTRLETNASSLRQINLHAGLRAFGLWSGNAFYEGDDFGSTYASVAADRNSEKLALSQHVLTLARGAGLNESLPRWRGIAGFAGGSWTLVSAADNEIAPLAPPASRPQNRFGRQQIQGIYAGFDYTPSPALWPADWGRLVLAARARLDQWRNFDAFQAIGQHLQPFSSRSESAVDPSLGLQWRPLARLRLHAAAYTSFRAPTLNELYRPFRVGNIMTLANPNLTAERYRGLQAGAAWQAAKNLYFSSTWFSGQASNLIASVTLSTTPQLITEQRRNLGRIAARGWITAARWRPHPHWRLWLDYTHQDSRVISGPVNLIGRRTPHVPANAASGNLLWHGRGWQASILERFGGSQAENDLNTLQLPSFWTTSLFVSHRLPAWAHGARPYLSVQNLWDRRFPVALTPSAELDAPRLWMLGLQWFWGGHAR